MRLEEGIWLGNLRTIQLASLARRNAPCERCRIMGAPHFYKHSGLVVSSDLDLPEWAAFACAPGKPDVRIVLSDDPCPDCPTEGCDIRGDALCFAVEGVGGWQVEGGHAIRLHPGLAAQPPELRLYTLGSAWAALGYQRGMAMWHASAVARNGYAVLLCGESGQGKSTLAAALVERGANLMSDDLARVDLSDGQACVYPSATRLKLWSQAIAHLGWQDRIVQQDWYREDKFHCAAPGFKGDGSPVRVAAIVSLEAGDSLECAQLTGAPAFETVLRQTLFRPEMVEALNGWGLQGAHVARIVSACPVYRLRRPRDLARLEETSACVEKLFCRHI